MSNLKRNGLKTLLDANSKMKLIQSYKLEIPNQSMTSVYLVSEAGQEKVIKIAPKDKNNKYSRSAKNQVIRENKVLKELNGFYGSPKHLGFYDLENYVAVAKEKLNFEYMDSWKGKGIEKYKALKNMINAFHERGISGLDLEISRNIAILNYDANNLTLFDFGKSIIKSENPSEYRSLIRSDESELFRMFAR